MLGNKNEGNSLESVKKFFIEESRRASLLKAITPPPSDGLRKSATNTRILSKKDWSDSVRYTHNYPPCSCAFAQSRDAHMVIPFDVREPPSKGNDGLLREGGGGD